MDTDYRKDDAAGRYVPIRGTNRADIEMYFDWYTTFSPEALESALLLTYLVTNTLMHEIYHHIVRGQKRLKRPSGAVEEKDAAQWAKGAVGHVFRELYPRERFEPHWQQVLAVLSSNPRTRTDQGETGSGNENRC